MPRNLRGNKAEPVFIEQNIDRPSLSRYVGVKRRSYERDVSQWRRRRSWRKIIEAEGWGRRGCHQGNAIRTTGLQISPVVWPMGQSWRFAFHYDVIVSAGTSDVVRVVGRACG